MVRANRSERAVLAIACVLPTLVTWLYFVALASAAPAVQQAAYGIGKSLQFALPVLWVFGIARERLAWPRPTGSGVARGLLFGGGVLALMLAIYHLWLSPTGILSPGSLAGQEVLGKVQGLGVNTVWRYAAMGVFYSFVHSGLEEYYWRWFVFGRLRRILPRRAAIGLSSAAFLLHHVLLLGTFFHWAPVPTVLLSVAIGVGGAVWAGIYERSGSLLGPWLSHLLIDAGIFLVGYDLVRGAF